MENAVTNHYSVFVIGGHQHPRVTEHTYIHTARKITYYCSADGDILLAKLAVFLFFCTKVFDSDISRARLAPKTTRACW